MPVHKNKAAIQDAGTVVALNVLDKSLERMGVSPETRDTVLAILSYSKEYFDFCKKMKKDPEDKKALAEFLLAKGIFIAHLSRDESAECYAAIAGFAIDTYSKAEFNAGGPIGVTVYGSLLVLDALEAGNSCEFLQKAYYDAFIKSAPSSSQRSTMKESIRPAVLRRS